MTQLYKWSCCGAGRTQRVSRGCAASIPHAAEALPPDNGHSHDGTGSRPDAAAHARLRPDVLSAHWYLLTGSMPDIYADDVPHNRVSRETRLRHSQLSRSMPLLRC